MKFILQLLTLATFFSSLGCSSGSSAQFGSEKNTAAQSDQASKLRPVSTSDDSSESKFENYLSEIESKFSDVSSDFDTLSSTIDDFRYSGENWRDTVDSCELNVSSLQSSLDDLEMAIASAHR